MTRISGNGSLIFLFYFIFNKWMQCKDLLLVIEFYQMWWLLKEPFLATYSAMSNPNSTKQGMVAAKRAVVFNISLQRLKPPPQLELPCAKRDQCILHTSLA